MQAGTATAADQAGGWWSLGYHSTGGPNPNITVYQSQGNNSSGSSVNGGNGAASGLYATGVVNPLSAGIMMSAAVQSVSATGFVLNWSTVTSGGLLHYLAIGGTDVNVYSQNFTGRSTTGTQAISGLGFAPKIVMFFYGNNATTGGAAGFGMAESSTNRWACSMSQAVAPSMSSAALVSRVQDTTKCISLLNNGGATTLLAAADLVSMDANGFTLNWTTATATAYTINYLAFGGTAQMEIGYDTKPANTTDTVEDIVMGFQPQGVLMFGNGTTNNTAQSTGWRLTMGLAGFSPSSGDQYPVVRQLNCEAKNGVSPSQCRRRITDNYTPGTNDSIIYQRPLPVSTTASGNVEVQMSGGSASNWVSTGLSLGYGVNGVTTQYVWPWFAIAEPPISMPNPESIIGGPVDKFDDKTIGAGLWSTWTSGTGTSQSESGDWLQQSQASSPNTGYVGVSSAATYDLTNKAVIAQIHQPPAYAVGSQAYLRVELDVNNGVIIGWGDQGNLFMQTHLGGSYATVDTESWNTIFGGLGQRPGCGLALVFDNAQSRLWFATKDPVAGWVARHYVAIPFATTALRVIIATGSYQAISGSSCHWESTGLAVVAYKHLPTQNYSVGKSRTQAYRDEYGQMLNASGAAALWRLGDANPTIAVYDTSRVTPWRDGSVLGSSTRQQPGPHSDGIDRCWDLASAYFNMGDWQPVITSGFSVECWFNADTWVSGCALMNRRSAANVGGYSLELAGTDGTLNWHVYAGGAWYSATTWRPLALGQWHHVVARYDPAGTISIIVNGAIEASTAGVPVANNPASGTVETYIGRSNVNTALRWDGRLDDIAFYESAMSLATAQAHYRLSRKGRDAYAALIEATSGLVAYWPMREVGTANCFDESGNGLTMRTNPAGCTSGVSGNPKDVPSVAIQLDGTGNATIDGAYPMPQLDFSSAPFTIEGWFYRDAADTGPMPLFDYHDGATGGVHCWLYDTADKIYANFVDSTGSNHIVESGYGAVAGNAWHHLVILRDVNTGAVYLDNILVGTIDLSGYALRFNVTFNIGFRPAAGWYKGKLSHWAAYNVALTPAQIQQHYGLLGGMNVAAAGRATATGSLTGRKSLNASAAAVATATAATTRRRALTATTNSATASTVGLFTARRLVRNVQPANGVAVAKASFGLSGKPAGVAVTTATISRRRPVTAFAAGVSTVAGTTTALRRLVAGAAGASTVNEQFEVWRGLAGTAAGTTTIVSNFGTPSDEYGSMIYNDPYNIAYWRLNETSGTFARDSSKSGGHHATYVGSPLLNQPGAIAGNTDTAPNFSGTGQYITVPDFVLTGSFTVEAWVKADAWGNGFSLVNRRDASNVGGFTLECAADGSVQFFVYSNTWNVIQTAPKRLMQTGVWHHVVGVYHSGGSGLVMIDGEDCGRTGAYGTINNPTGAMFQIGRNTASAFTVDGQIDEVAIYNTNLADATIQSHYRIGRKVRDNYSAAVDRTPGLVAYWRLDEEVVGNAMDATGRGHTLLETNMTYNVGGVGSASSHAVYYNGTTAKITASVIAVDLNFGTGPWTWEMWVYQTTLATGPIIEYGDATNWGLHIWQWGTAANVWINAGAGAPAPGGINSGDFLVANVWNHVVVSRQPGGGVMRCYINGVQRGGDYAPGAGFAIGSNYPINFGFRPSGSPSNYYRAGYLDDVAAYNRALTTTEINEHYAKGLGTTWKVDLVGAAAGGAVANARSPKPPTLGAFTDDFEDGVITPDKWIVYATGLTEEQSNRPWGVRP